MKSEDQTDCIKEASKTKNEKEKKDIKRGSLFVRRLSLGKHKSSARRTDSIRSSSTDGVFERKQSVESADSSRHAPEGGDDIADVLSSEIEREGEDTLSQLRVKKLSEAGHFKDMEEREDLADINVNINSSDPEKNVIDSLTNPSSAQWSPVKTSLSKQGGYQDTSNLGASAPERREHLYKILVIGELGTGKTSIIKQYVHQFFNQQYRATIGVDFALKVLNWDKAIIRLQLWDIAGQERYGHMTRVYYKEAVGAFIVFDVTRVATFDAVVKWKEDLDSKVQLPDGSPIPCVLLANKCDQPKEGLVNMPAKMDEYCREKGFVGWFETSAKENINIDEAAHFLVDKILQNDKMTNSIQDSDKIAIDSKQANKQKSCSC